MCARGSNRALLGGPSTSPLDGMSAYKDALYLDSTSSEQRLQLAANLLLTGEVVVLLEGCLALRPYGGRITCEVIDEWSEAQHSQAEYEAMLGRGKSLLFSSKLGSMIPLDRLDWVVVQDYGTGTTQVWPAV